MTVRNSITRIHFRFRHAVCALVIMLLAILQVAPACAAVTETNSDTDYKMIIDDQAGYFSDDEIDDLIDVMTPITDYSNVAVLTTESHSYSSTSRLAEAYSDDNFGSYTNRIVFVIDRDLNEIYLDTGGKIRRTINSSRATSITDNTYVYATASYGRDYYTCAYKTMEQVLTLLEGGRIAEPMRYICSALLAIIIALMLNYFIVMFYSRSRKESAKEILGGIYSDVKITNPSTAFVNQTKRYSPPSSSGGGSSGGGGSPGGGGHSGGGHSI